MNELLAKFLTLLRSRADPVTAVDATENAPIVPITDLKGVQWVRPLQVTLAKAPAQNVLADSPQTELAAPWPVGQFTHGPIYGYRAATEELALIGAMFTDLDEATPTAYALNVASFPFLESGGPGSAANANRARGASSATTDPALIQVGIPLGQPAAEWTSVHTPAANTQATTTKAAGGATQRHICKTISATLSSDAAATAAIDVYLRDGASGVGTIIWSATLRVPATDSRGIHITGLSIPGSLGTAMTLEFAAAGGALTMERVTLGGITYGA